MDERRDDHHVRWEPHWEVLEVGCASGYFLDSLEGKVRMRVGSELNEEDCAYANEKLAGGAPLVWAMPLSSFSIYGRGPGFHCICAFDVLEHIEDPLEFLGQIKARLKQGGYVYLQMPNLEDALLTVYQTEGFADFWYRKPHIWYFNKKTLYQLLTRAGFGGTIWSVEEYSLATHMNWMLHGKPRETIYEGRAVAQLLGKGEMVDALNDFHRNADKTYREGLGLLGIGNRLRAWIQAI